jgi:hypothetical protein
MDLYKEKQKQNVSSRYEMFLQVLREKQEGMKLDMIISEKVSSKFVDRQKRNNYSGLAI